MFGQRAAPAGAAAAVSPLPARDGGQVEVSVWGQPMGAASLPSLRAQEHRARLRGAAPLLPAHPGRGKPLKSHLSSITTPGRAPERGRDFHYWEAGSGILLPGRRGRSGAKAPEGLQDQGSVFRTGMEQQQQQQQPVMLSLE